MDPMQFEEIQAFSARRLARDNKTTRRMERRGFTLVEVLIVIAIITVIAMLIFPVFSGARAKANETHTGGSLRQLWTATQLYMTEHDLDRPPLRLDALEIDPRIQSLMRTPGAPWRPEEVESKARPECPYLGDFIYMRYVHPLWTEEGWSFWAQSRLPTLPMFVSLQPSFHELTGLPINPDVSIGGCGSYEARMVSRSLQVRFDGSLLNASHPRAGQDYFMYGNLF